MPKVDLKQDYRAEDGTLYRRGQAVEVSDAFARALRGGRVARTAAPPPPPTGDLAENFPGRAALVEAGITTQDAVRKLSREQLIAVKGIGEKTADEIAEALK